VAALLGESEKDEEKDSTKTGFEDSRIHGSDRKSPKVKRAKEQKSRRAKVQKFKGQPYKKDLRIAVSKESKVC